MILYENYIHIVLVRYIGALVFVGWGAACRAPTAVFLTLILTY